MTDLPPPAARAALAYGWEKYPENAGPLIAVVVVPVIGLMAFSAIGQVALHGRLALIGFEILAIVVNTIAGLGVFRAALMITAGEPVGFAQAFRYDRWGAWLVFSSVFGVLVGLGLTLCIVPGLLFLAFFGLAPFYFIDGGMRLGQALSASREVARSNGLAFPILLSIVVGALGFLVFVLGVFVTEPIAYLALAYLYRHATGQPVAE